MTRKVTGEQAKREANKYADRVSQEDVEDIVGKESKFKQLFEYVEKLAQYWDDVKIVFAMLKDCSTGKYTKCPWRAIAVLAGALIYVMTPLDLIPDFIPLIGWTDDCLVLAFALKMARADLEEYKAWKSTQKKRNIKLLTK